MFHLWSLCRSELISNWMIEEAVNNRGHKKGKASNIHKLPQDNQQHLTHSQLWLL